MRKLFVVFLLFSILNSAPAQQASHSIVGKVTDRMGGGIQYAVIIVDKDDASKISGDHLFRVTTNEEGSFRIDDVQPGKYRIKISIQGDCLERSLVISDSDPVVVRLDSVLGLGCNGMTGTDESVPEDERAEIVNKALSQTIRSYLFERKQLKRRLIVSTENIKPEWLKNFKEFRLQLMSKKQVQQKADFSGDFLYTSFPTFKMSSQCVVIEVTNTWAVGKNSHFVYISGGGITYEFRKVDGKWVMKPIGGWIS